MSPLWVLPVLVVAAGMAAVAVAARSLARAARSAAAAVDDLRALGDRGCGPARRGRRAPPARRSRSPTCRQRRDGRGAACPVTSPAVFNVGGPEVLVILLLALIVLGPQRLPDAARQLGKITRRDPPSLDRVPGRDPDRLRRRDDTAARRPGRRRRPPPAAIEPSAVSAATAAAGPEQVPAQPAKPARRRRSRCGPSGARRANAT